MDSKPADIVVTQQLLAQFEDGRKGVVEICICQPILDTKATWSCTVEITGLANWTGPRTIFGEGSLQPLILAIGMVKAELIHALRSGTTFFWPTKDMDPNVNNIHESQFDIEFIFSPFDKI